MTAETDAATSSKPADRWLTNPALVATLSIEKLPIILLDLRRGPHALLHLGPARVCTMKSTT